MFGEFRPRSDPGVPNWFSKYTFSVLNYRFSYKSVSDIYTSLYFIMQGLNRVILDTCVFWFDSVFKLGGGCQRPRPHSSPVCIRQQWICRRTIYFPVCRGLLKGGWWEFYTGQFLWQIFTFWNERCGTTTYQWWPRYKTLIHLDEKNKIST